MKLLFLNAVGEIGGAERVLLTLLKTLRSTDPSLQLMLIVASPGPLVEAAQLLGVKVWTLPLPDSISRAGDSQFKERAPLLKKLWAFLELLRMIPALWKYLRSLHQTIQKIQPNLIHSNSIKTHILMAFIWHLNIPVIWHIHDFYQSRPLVAKILSWAKYSATQAIAISRAVAEDTRLVLPSLPVTVIYNAIDVHQFIPAPHYAKNPEPFRIGLVATFAHWKGHRVFLDAAAQVVQVVGDLPLRFCIVGGPIYTTPGSQVSLLELQKHVQDLQLEAHVEFLGFQADMVRVYHSLDVVVHASTQPEPFGLVIAEAMACGKPVIVSKSGGAAELFTPGQDAIGVPPGDVTALADALLQLIHQPQTCQTLGINARQTAVARYGCDRLKSELLATYGKLSAY
jgi:glycosyltransferase involved in cell wall biosynthesis